MFNPEGFRPGKSDPKEILKVSTELKIEKPKTLPEEIGVALEEMNGVEGGEKIKGYINGLASEKIEIIDNVLNFIGETFSSLPLSEEEDRVIEILAEIVNCQSATEVTAVTKRNLKELLQ